jgi:hypothetical protein
MIEELKELKNMLDQDLINQDEHARLRAEVLRRATDSSCDLPGMPAKPPRNEFVFRDPHTGATTRVTKRGSFWFTFLFGVFYLLYKEIWLHAAIAAILAIFTYGLSWLIYPFFAYRIIVDNYRRKDWVEAEVMMSAR